MQRAGEIIYINYRLALLGRALNPSVSRCYYAFWYYPLAAASSPERRGAETNATLWLIQGNQRRRLLPLLLGEVARRSRDGEVKKQPSNDKR